MNTKRLRIACAGHRNVPLSDTLPEQTPESEPVNDWEVFDPQDKRLEFAARLRQHKKEATRSA